MNQLLQIMARLRDPETGCPWDAEQDFSSIAPYTIEEAYEVADAIERRDMDDLRDTNEDLLERLAEYEETDPDGAVGTNKEGEVLQSRDLNRARSQTRNTGFLSKIFLR